MSNLIMDAESKSFYDQAISNFMMLKIFHDAGIDVKNFPSYLSDYNYNDTTEDIFISGIKGLFPDYKYFSLYDDSEENEVVFKKLDTGAEYLYCLKDFRMEKILQTPYKEEFRMFLKEKASFLDFCEADLIWDDEYGAVIAIYFHSMLHEIAEIVVYIHRELESYMKLVEEKK